MRDLKARMAVSAARAGEPNERAANGVQGNVLIAEDDVVNRAVLTRILKSEGYAVEAVTNGAEAVEAFDRGSFDLVVSDIDMPGSNGIDLLRAIRQRDPEVPVVLLTGGPTLDTAIMAIEHHANRYLTKPVDHGVLRDATRRAIQASRLAHVRRKFVELDGAEPMESSSLALLQHRFEQALHTLFMVYQPIVRWSDRSVFAHEALVRSLETSVPHPGALFDAAERLNRVHDVGRVVRSLAPLPLQSANQGALFVNLHTRDLLDDALYDPQSPLAAEASRVVLEITERARLEVVGDVPARIRRLRKMGFRIALDDLGAGYAGLASFAALEPDFIKLDMSLVRGIHESKTKQKLVGSMIDVCVDLDVSVVAEGIENAAERDTLLELGCDLLQGFLFARPDRDFLPSVPSRIG
ncbi:MAG TPA: EAL domain-containing protein [Polyangiaceae bacterium]